MPADPLKLMLSEIFAAEVVGLDVLDFVPVAPELGAAALPQAAVISALAPMAAKPARTRRLRARLVLADPVGDSESLHLIVIGRVA
jgi:hypothetical protein